MEENLKKLFESNKSKDSLQEELKESGENVNEEKTITFMYLYIRTNGCIFTNLLHL